MARLDCFKAYDIRGQVPKDLDEAGAYRIGRAFARFVEARQVVLGQDARLTSMDIADGVARGITDAGADVIDIGLCGTEEVYFGTIDQQADGGVMVTASHNPPDWNGLKLVREAARPISGDTGLGAIREAALADTPAPATAPGRRLEAPVKDRYIAHLLTYLEGTELGPLRILLNAGNGTAGRVLDALMRHLPVELIPMHQEPDGRFPNGVPNPLLPERRAATSEAVRAYGADFGVAFDGDFDRCFFFDEAGEFVEGYYLVGLLATAQLARHPGGKVVHDPRLVWNTEETVREAGGVPVLSKAGHAFMKETMRREDAVYGGEMSAHHFFREFGYCDSGMVPWLLMAAQLSKTGQPLSHLVARARQAYPVSGELNFEVNDPPQVLARLRDRYAAAGGEVTELDGLSIAFDDWRFNVRPSNTEPLLRLNVETRGDPDLLQAKTEELSTMIRAEGG